MASNEIPDHPDTLMNIISNHALVMHIYILPHEF